MSLRAKEFMRDVVHSTHFQQSEVWNAKKVAEDLFVAVQNQDRDQLHRARVYVQPPP